MKACPRCDSIWPLDAAFWAGSICSACHAETPEGSEAEHAHAYLRAQHEGAAAATGTRCPYPASDLGRRCAWLAGYWDAGRTY